MPRILPRDFRAPIPPSPSWHPRPEEYEGHVALQRAVRELWYAASSRGLAGAVGRPYGTARAWITGRRRPPPDVMRALARWLRQHASTALELAAALDTAATARERAPRRLTGMWQRWSGQPSA